MNCKKCNKEIDRKIPYIAVVKHLEKQVEDKEIEVLKAEELDTYCKECYKW